MTVGVPQDVGVLLRAGSRLHYWTAGPQHGPVVVLTHGASMDHRMFDAQLPALTDAGYRTVTWDIRGHGQSKPLGTTPLTVRDIAADLLALLDDIGQREPVCLVGQSLGGYVAQEVVFRDPQRVAAVAVVGSTCTTAPIRRWEHWALRSSPWWFRIWPDGDLRSRIARSTAVTGAAQAYAGEATRQLTKAEFVAVWQAVARASHPEPGYRIEHPLLLTHGDQDRTGNIARTAPQWAAREPQCRYEVIPGAGHNANQDNPEAFNQLLLAFLAGYHPAQ